MAHTEGYGNGLWVLVADADEQAARGLASRLHRQGFWAYPTSRGDEALRLVRAYPVSLAVIDVRLGDMAGPELTRRLRAVDDRLPVVITTRDRSPESEVAARQAGIIYYAYKPISLRWLRAVVEKAIASPGHPVSLEASNSAPRSDDHA